MPDGAPAASTSELHGGVGGIIASFDPSPYVAYSGNDKPAGEGSQGLAEQTQLAVTDDQATESPKKLTVALLDNNFKLALGGAVIADFFFNTARPVAPGAPYYLAPRPVDDFRQATFDASARQTYLFGRITGPKIGDFETGAEVRVNFYSNPIIQDQYGILPLRAFGYLRNDNWQFAAGLQQDIFNPLNPTVLPFTALIAAGNTGLLRSQGRIERFFHPSEDSEITVTLGVSDPIPTLVDNEFQISEPNGWPNVEGRVALALGPLVGKGPDAARPFELGISGVVGQIRTGVAGQSQVVADVWGVGSDLRWAITDRFGVQGEVFVGQTLGTYGGGILQDINSVTFRGVRSAGGWCEVYYYLCPDKVHSHAGYGTDDPLDSDLAPGQRLRNEAYFANLIWEVTEAYRLAGEVTYRKTSYVALANNDGVGFQFQAQWRF
ncbi:MAG TPA: hypothetical protein VG055_20880 [Planctomycetaceae bacterium]|jgi:hypothetical protein|nr:hypothetical protein [Planctomycetaceae bacterium]